MIICIPVTVVKKILFYKFWIILLSINLQSQSLYRLKFHYNYQISCCKFHAWKNLIFLLNYVLMYVLTIKISKSILLCKDYSRKILRRMWSIKFVAGIFELLLDAKMVNIWLYDLVFSLQITYNQ